MQNDIENVRHSLAHLLAAAVLELWPQTKQTIGPAIENGFYYDFDVSGKITKEDLPRIEKRMREILKTWKKFEKQEVSEEIAKSVFPENEYKKELIDEILGRNEKLTLYRSGNYVDLCRGGHIDDIKKIRSQSFRLDRLAGAYWRGNVKNKMLTRIYGLAFETEKELEEYIATQEEAKKRDHKKLGAELDLFFIDEKVGRGLPMWTPKGTAVKFELENFTRELERKYGYEHVSTPYLGAEELYKTSGHLAHYGKNMYAPIDMDGDVFYLRPMACPHHIRMFQRKPWSYKELPVRYAEIADYNRYEKSGELMGMIRARKFQLTDAHIFVVPENIKEEFKRVCSLIREGIKGLGLDAVVSYRFSKRDAEDKEKYYPDEALWIKAEGLVKEALDESGFDYSEMTGEAAFYGPKLDIQAKNMNGKEDTLFTAQIDFLLPEKFNLEYAAEDGTKKRPVMIHHSSIGALERTFAYLIEHYAGAFPVWLAPVQVAILPVSEKFNDYAKKVYTRFLEKGIRVEIKDGNETLGKRIREAQVMKIPYMLIVGEKEEKSKTVSERGRSGKDYGRVKPDKFIENLEKEIAEKNI